MTKYNIIDPKTSNNKYDELLYKYSMPPFRTGYIELTNHKYLMPLYYTKFMNDIENFQVFDTDIFVLSHPKTGTTWTQEMVWCIANQMQISTEYIYKRFPFLELSTLFEPFEQQQHHNDTELNTLFANSIKFCENLKHPRFIKSHLPWQLLPRQIRDGTRQPQLIYIYRNPKDTCVSYYHHYVQMEGFTGDFNQFVELFLNGRTVFGPFPDHIKSYQAQTHLTNLLFLKYEDMKLNLSNEIQRTMQFLNKTTNSCIDINKLCEHLSFESMRKNNAVNYESVSNPESDVKFMRSGVIGSYKAQMTTDIEQQFDKWIHQHFNDHPHIQF